MRFGVLAGATVLGLALAGCSSAESASTVTPPTTYAGPPIGATAPPAPAASAAPGASAAPSASAAPAAAAASGAPAAPGASTAPGAPAKVSANTASEEEIFSALTKAGVANPSRWSAEVIEYRPYPANDPNLGKLRQNLAKYNPGPGVVDKIVSALTP
jgi:DNA uptake protein ComE-like DNA-binding protein